MLKRGFIGSVFMVSGCAMGAGCLALPLLAAGPNFIFSSLFLIFSGILSYFIARVSLEVFLVYKNEVNISTIAKYNFGQIGVALFGIINGTLMYALLTVYMAGGSDLLDKTVFPLLGIKSSNQTSLLIFLVIVLPVFFNGYKVIVKSNKLIFILKLVSFLIAVIIGLGFISPNLATFKLEQIRYLPKALPIFLAALWFHFLIPVIARLNDYDRVKCRKVFLVGIILPVTLYILWIGIMLSLIPRDGTGNTFFSLLSHNQSLGRMIDYATHNNSHLPNLMKLALNVFSNIAMLTSFLTVGISTYDYIRDALKIRQTRQGKLSNLILTMLPPVFLVLFFPEGFVFILQQAAILLMLTNGLVLICCLKEYDRLGEKPGRAMIWFLLLILVILILFQALDNINLLPSLGA